jgi:aminopeptidase N
LIIDRESQVFKLKAESEAIIPSLLRDFSAPVKLSYQYSQSELATLFANDPNDFNRWDAGQSLMTNLLLSEDNEIPAKQLDQVASAFKNILEDESLDCALKALAIQTPELSSLIGASNDINIDLLIKKNKQLKRTLGQSLEPTWFNLYNTLAGKNSGERWLKNIALRYMMIGNQEKHLELAINQLNHASNMTEEIAALQVIANTDSGYKTEHIQKFYDKWQEEELVLDKWFSAQVLNDNEKMLEHVLDLLEHPKFSIENPNKVRAVIGTFVAGNLAQFHNPTGNGYEFLGDAVIKLNSINPQIAAGLTKQFNAWRKLDKKRQSLIKEQLERIKSTPDLSADVFEIVEKSLNA